MLADFSVALLFKKYFVLLLMIELKILIIYNTKLLDFCHRSFEHM